MDRKSQLANVSFGGAWSEQIAGNEAMRDAMHTLDVAAQECVETDLRDDPDVREAVRTLAGAHPKGAQLTSAWEKGLGLGNAVLRKAELMRIASVLKAGRGERLKF
jgi:hypothetical protein